MNELITIAANNHDIAAIFVNTTALEIWGNSALITMDQTGAVYIDNCKFLNTITNPLMKLDLLYSKIDQNNYGLDTGWDEVYIERYINTTYRDMITN